MVVLGRSIPAKFFVGIFVLAVRSLVLAADVLLKRHNCGRKKGLGTEVLAAVDCDFEDGFILLAAIVLDFDYFCGGSFAALLR